LVRVFHQCPYQDLLQRCRQIGPGGARRGWWIVDVLEDDAHRGVGVKGKDSRDQLVEDNPQRIDV